MPHSNGFGTVPRTFCGESSNSNGLPGRTDTLVVLSAGSIKVNSTAPIIAKVGQSGLLTITWFSDQVPPEGKGYYHHRRPWPRCLHPAVKEYRNEIGYD
jgi:hypothetical protein